MVEGKYVVMKVSKTRLIVFGAVFYVRKKSGSEEE